MREFASWARGSSRPLAGSVDEAELLLTLRHDSVGVAQPAQLTEQSLRELLLAVYPGKVVVLDEADIGHEVPTAREIVAFLVATGRVPTSHGKRLDAAVDEIEPQFADAVMDPANWGVARGGQGFGNPFDVHDLDPQESVLGMDFDLQAALDLPEHLPPMRLPAQPVLAAAARGTQLLLRTVELARWVGQRRAVDENAELTAPDAVEAAAALGIPLPPPRKPRRDALPEMPEPPEVKSMRDIPELTHLW